MAMILMSKDAKDWSYKGEGAANLVLGYRGSSPSLIGKVLRIHKVVRGENHASIECKRFLSACEQLLWADVPQLAQSTSKEIAEQVFTMQVMGPLLDSKHIDGGVQIFVTKEFLESVEREVHSKGPAWRFDATEVDVLSHFALLISDHSVFSPGAPNDDICIAVEIKPKCGFLPTSEFIARRNAVKKYVTRFRMHQLLKLHLGEISQLSEYNPLDLFSGSREQINCAIAALFATPHNNFRIFLNGSLIFGDLEAENSPKAVCSSNISSEMGISIEDQIKVFIQGGQGLRLGSFTELVSEAIFKSGVLDRLLAVQKLDVLDIEGAIHLYYNIISEPCIACKNMGDSESIFKYSCLHSLSLKESLKAVKDFLIAATAKDCSLMISFKPRHERDSSNYNFIQLQSSKQIFDYKAYFIDLDIKPLDKMIHYYELDNRIASFYSKNVGHCENGAISN